MDGLNKRNQRDVNIGKRVKSCREKKGLTQTQVIERILALPENKGKERSEKQISYIESGLRPLSVEYAVLLGKVLEVNPEYLLLNDDFPTESARFSHTISSLKEESSLLFSGLWSFAKLVNFTIEPPNMPNKAPIEEHFLAIKPGYRISYSGQTISLSLEEMNAFENEVCDFVELKLKHLFKQKGGNFHGIDS